MSDDEKECWLSQPPDLVYRAVDGRYFVTNPGRREVVVLNRAGFAVLELCHQRTIKSLRSMLEAGGDDAFAVDATDVGGFVRLLETHGLVAVTAARVYTSGDGNNAR